MMEKDGLSVVSCLKRIVYPKMKINSPLRMPFFKRRILKKMSCSCSSI